MKFGFTVSPSSEQLEEWEKLKQKYYPSKLVRSTYNTRLKHEKGSIHVTYYPQDMKNHPQPLLLFEMSLAKLVNGENISMIQDPSEAIEIGSQVIRQNPQVPVVDLHQGILYRLDLCYNFLVGETVPEWIRQLFKLEYPWRVTKPYYPTQGVQYYSKHASLSFYDKEAETRDAAAKGILRMEASWRDKSRIGGLVGKSVARIGDFPSDVVFSLLNAELDKLGIKDRAPVDSLAALRILRDRYKPEQGLRLYGFLKAVQSASRKELMDWGMTKQTIWRNKKAIKEAGLSMCIAENERALPLLVINPRSLVE